MAKIETGFRHPSTAQRDDVIRAMAFAKCVAQLPVGFDWEETRDPDENADNYLNTFVSSRISNDEGFGQQLNGLIYMRFMAPDITGPQHLAPACEEIVSEITGNTRPLTRREALLLYTGIQMTLTAERTVSRTRETLHEALTRVRALMEQSGEQD